MSVLTNAKHIIEEIDGVRCSVVEKEANASRVEFIKSILEYNGLEVKVQEEVKTEEDAPGDKKFTVGVTDRVFNIVFVIYECRLKNPEGHWVTPAIWRQETTEFRPEYFLEGKTKTPDIQADPQRLNDSYGPLQ